jgi:excisionase family DNA binding protein
VERRYVGPKELSEHLGLAIATVYDWIYRKKIPHYKMGRLVRFDLKEIDEWARERRVEEFR